MQYHMTPILAFYIKLTIAGIIGLGALIADALPDVSGWENVGTKSILIVAVIYMGKLYLQQQKDHKEEAIGREEKLIAHIAESTNIQNQLLTATKEQTGYFQTVTRNIVNERLQERQDIKTIAEKVS